MNKIIKTLSRLGLTANYVGFYYAAEALSLSLQDHSRLHYVSKLVYPDIAKHFHTSIACVERDLRTIVAKAWANNPALLSEMANHALTKAPTNGEFLAIITTYITRSTVNENQ